MKPTATWLQRLSPMRSCREVTALLIAQEDRPLHIHERLGLRLHLPLCQACQRMQHQVLLMRQAMRQWRDQDQDKA